MNAERGEDDGFLEAGTSCDASATQPVGGSARLRLGSKLVDGRFEILRRVGEGATGCVYEAFDAERRARVALKTLSLLDPTGIYQLKREFRLLSGLHHPHLIRLHELFCHEELWFFTMDLVDGEPFDRWVRPHGSLQPERLLTALVQLTAALEAVHGAGKLHRDLKPSNVLVSAAGRLVVLDFGLATERAAGELGHALSTAGTIAGTPAYMAPEQATAKAELASDWYAVGVMLFEALTGRRPFEGYAAEVLGNKLFKDAPASGDERDPQLGPLHRICSALLARDPAARPGAIALRALLPLERDAEVSSARPQARGRTRLVGRRDELELLRDSYRKSVAGHACVVLVSGESGIGKSALCDAFLGELRAEQRAVVLSGRCYERENVPFKALDALMDDLSRHLDALPARDAASLLPRDAFALSRLFPVLNRVEVVAEAPSRPIVEPLELQRRAFAAFSELLARIRDRQPLVWHIDDLHWTDSDSVQLMRHLFVQRAPMPALFIATHRDSPQHQAGVARVLEAVRSNPELECRLVELEPLDAESIQQLALTLMPDTSTRPDIGPLIARESEGNPFLATELVHYAAAAAADQLASVSLATALRVRFETLPDRARRLLQVLAIVGQPLPLATAIDASATSRDDLDTLRAFGLIRGAELVECYHDRIRENVTATLSAEVSRALHAELARAIAREAAPDPELLCRCCEGAGASQDAADHATRAAENAATALAFEHAAGLYEKALELGTYSAARQLELCQCWAEALVNAGLGAEASAVFLRAASLCDGLDALDLRRRAAAQLLVTGHVAEGFRLLQDVCSAVELELPTQRARALASLAWSSARLRWRGLAAGPARELDDRTTLRLRTASTVVWELNGYLPIHAAAVASGLLLDALEFGDTPHLALALGGSSVGLTLLDPTSRWARRLEERMLEVASAIGDRELHAVLSVIQAAIAFDRGELTAALHHSRRAVEGLRECEGLSIELDAAKLFVQLGAELCGDYRTVQLSSPELIDEALRRGRAWLAAMLMGCSSVPAWLATDDVRGYRDLLAEVRRRWPERDPPGWPEYALLTGESMMWLYLGEPIRGLQLLDARRDSYRSSLLTRGTGSRSLRYPICASACAASALAATGGHDAAQRRRLIGAVRAHAARLARSRAPAWLGVADTREAACALALGEPEHARTLLQRALRALESSGAGMYAAAARRRLGEMLGGDTGAEHVAAAELAMRAQGIVNVEEITEVLCPGCRTTR